MELKSEVISISKVRDGIFIGDMRAGINLDLLMQFKISHLINATGMQLSYSFESLGIKYLTIKWSENPPEDSKAITNEIVSRVISFVDDSNMNGEGLLGFSFNGKNRICVIIILYLMTKFHWPLNKCYEYLKKKKEDMDINAYYRNQLSEYEKKLYNNNSIQLIQPTLYWNLDELKDKDELLMRNTYKNEVENFKNENKKNLLDEIKTNIIRHVEWGDNKKYARQMVDPGLIHYNLDEDLFLKKEIKDITEHIHKKPLKSCIKHPNNSNVTTGSNGRKKKKTKIYLQADANTINNSNKNSVSKTSPVDVNTDEIITKRNNNENKNNYHISDKINVYDDNNVQTDKKQQNKGDEEDLKDEDKIDLAQNDEEDKNKKQNNHIINNLAITSKNADGNEKNKEIKYHTDIDVINKEIKENKKIILNSNDIEFNIINMNSQKITNEDIKPILNNLLKIDPNLQTLKKYLKSTKKKTLINFSNTLSNIKINKVNPQNSTNLNLNSVHSAHVNTNTNSISDSNNTPTIHTISNNNDINSNNINLIPIKLNNNLNNQNNSIKNKNKEEKKSNGLYLLNLNVNIDNRNTYNIKNNIINNPNNNNNGFNKKLNNFFMDANGNNYFNAFNKFRNRRNNNSEQKDSLNNKLFPSNINYYLGKQNSHINTEEEKKEDIIIPNIAINRNSHSTNNQKNNNKNDKIKMFIRPAINIDKNNINNMINKDFSKNNISNPNAFIRKDSKCIFIYYI